MQHTSIAGAQKDSRRLCGGSATSRPRVSPTTGRVRTSGQMGRPSFDLARPKGKDYEAAPVLHQDLDEEDGFVVEAAPKRNREPNRKMYLFFFISMTVILCFGLFVVIPQLIDYFTAPNETSVDSESGGIYGSRKQSVIQILNTERSRRNQERLEILRKFKDLQENYKHLQIEFKKAQESYLTKLRNAYRTEGLETSVENLTEQTSNSPPEEDESFHIDIEIKNERENKTSSTETTGNKIVP